MYVNDIPTIVFMVDSPILLSLDTFDFFKPQSDIRRHTFQLVLKVIAYFSSIIFCICNIIIILLHGSEFIIKRCNFCKPSTSLIYIRTCYCHILHSAILHKILQFAGIVDKSVIRNLYTFARRLSTMPLGNEKEKMKIVRHHKFWTSQTARTHGRLIKDHGVLINCELKFNHHIEA